ncbi:MAG: hypothetical protein AVDCRST_MAG49-1369, partial [uncultured Thermomicrobiales bacterium]
WANGRERRAGPARPLGSRSVGSLRLGRGPVGRGTGQVWSRRADGTIWVIGTARRPIPARTWSGVIWGENGPVEPPRTHDGRHRLAQRRHVSLDHAPGTVTGRARHGGT